MDATTAPNMGSGIHRRPTLSLLMIGVLALAGAALITFGTRWGPWAGSDSVEYVEAARNLAAGKGLVLVRASGNVVPLHLRPPAYAVLLAVLSPFGLDASDAGRVSSVFFFFLLLFSPAALVHLVKDKYILPFTFQAYLLGNPELVWTWSGLMSEPLFIMLVVGAIGLAVAALSDSRRALLPAAAALAGAAWLTRFAGAACLAVVVLAPFLAIRVSFRQRMKGALLAAFIGSLPFTLWTLYLRLEGNTPELSLLRAGEVWDALQPVRLAYVDAIWQWLPLGLILPVEAYRPRAAILVVLAALTAWAAATTLMRARDRSGGPSDRFVLAALGVLLLLFSAAHASVVAASFLVVVYPKPDLDPRVLLPSQITFIPGLLLVLYSSVMQLRGKALRLALPIAIVLPLAWLGAPSSWQQTHQLNREGWGYNSELWQRSPIVDSLQALSPSLTVVSNDIDAVMFFARRPAFHLFDLDLGQHPSEWSRFGENPGSEPERRFAEGRAALVLFAHGPDKFQELYGDNAEARLDSLVAGLEAIYEGEDGTIYLAAEPE